jgi:type I restriction enzyme S subunit
VTTVLDEFSLASGWKEVPFRSIAVKVSQSGFPDLESLSVFLDAGVVPRSSREDNHNQLGESLEKYQRVLPNDLVFNKLRTWQGGFGISNYEGIVSPAYIITRPNTTLVDPRFLEYLLKSKPYLTELTRLSKWMPPTQFDISWESIRDLKLRIPALKSQIEIADYLDHHTKIARNLLKNKQLAVESLELMLRSEISSDLQSIAANYEKHPLRYLLSEIRTGGTPDEDLHSDTGVPWYSPASISNYGNLGEPIRTLPTDASTNEFVRFKYPSVLIVGIGATAGKVAYLDHTASSNQQITCLKTNSLISAKFLYYFLYSERENLLARANYTTLPILNNEFLKTVEIVVPPLDEQIALSKKWDEMKRIYEGSIEKISTSIQLIEEYSESVISQNVVKNSLTQEVAK